MSLRSYLSQLFERPEQEVAAATVIRNFATWFFQLLRNFVLVGVLKYFYDKTGSEVLLFIHQIAICVIFVYCLTYADQWYLNLFGFLSNKRIASWLNLVVNILIGIGFFLLINKATSIMVAEISRAQY